MTRDEIRFSVKELLFCWIFNAVFAIFTLMPSLPKTITAFLILSFLLSVGIPTAFAGLESTNYSIKDYSFDGANSTDGQSPNYDAFGVGGDSNAGKNGSANFSIGAGLNQTIQANVPPAPTFTNPSNYYNKLHLVINTGNNPTDAKFAIAISTDNFASDTRFVQDNQSIGSVLGIEDWQTYTAWGGGSGFDILGLVPGTTYTAKVAAIQGSFTQTGFGPTVSAATDQPTLSFDIDVASTDTETSPPYILTLDTLVPGTLATSTQKVWVDIDTNASNGAGVYISGKNDGLKSTSVNYTINSVTNDLNSIGEGYGIRQHSLNQTSGGPLKADAPYDNTVSGNVGEVNTSEQLLFDSSNQQITGGRGSFDVEAKASTSAPASTDYADVLRIISTGMF